MVFSSCSVHGCKTKCGQGLILRQFPSKNPSLARQWLENLPAGFRVSPNRAVCELHFELTEFERPREDGKKKLKNAAVPRIFLSPVQSSTPTRRPLGEVNSPVPLCSSTPLRNYKSRAPRNVNVRPGIGDHNYISNRKKENRPPTNTIITDCLNSLRGYPSESITTESKGKNDGSPIGNSDTSADSGFSMGNTCDKSSIFCPSDILEIQFNDGATSVANICDVSSIICTPDVSEVTMTDMDAASDNNRAMLKQVTDSYTANETVSATDNATACFSGKTNGSPSQTSDVSADSGLSMGNFCGTSSIFCTSNFLEIPLNDEETSLDNNPAMVKQATDSSTGTEILSAIFNAAEPCTGKTDSCDTSVHSGISSGSICDITGILSTSDLFDTPKDSNKTSLADDIAVVEQEDFISDLSTVTRDNVLKLVAKQREEITRLVKVCQENEKKNRELQRLVDNAQKMKLKYLAKKKAVKRLQTRLQSRTFSPWLTKSQQLCLLRNSNRGVKWDPELIREGLILKMKCGTTGYAAFVEKYPLLPSVRSLQEAIQFIKFGSGLLEEVFDLLEAFAKKSCDWGRDCQLVLDEMQIEEGERYDASTKKMVGQCTFPTHSGRATKVLVIMLAGIMRRWKIPVAVYLTSKKDEEFKKKKGEKDENPLGVAFAGIINQVITRAENAQLKVCGMTSDMGPDNLALWKALGITGGKLKTLISSFRNPVRPDAEVCVMPDPVHLFKSIKSSMENNKIIELPADVVAEEGLTSSIVDYGHIDDLYKHEESFELKVAFRLKPENIHCKKQYSTMKVGTSRAVVCHRTAVGLQMLAKEKKNLSYRTTAWFFFLLNTFFELVTGRHKSMAVTQKNLEVYGKAIALIKKVEYVFLNSTIGSKKEWKPCQRGIRVLCATLLKLLEYFLDRRGYAFLLLGRFTQDCIENLFSLIRLRQPIPHAVIFFHCLKVITIAQYSIAVKNSNYDYDGGHEPAGSFDFLAEAMRRAEERAEARLYESIDELFANPIEKLSLSDLDSLSEWEQSVFYDMAGSVVETLTSINVSVCEKCLDALKLKAGHHPRSIVTEMKEYTALRPDEALQNPLQVYVSDTVYKALLTAEVTFRKYRHRTLHFKNTDVQKYFTDNLMYVWAGSLIPDCHNIGRKILDIFFESRLKEFGQVLRKHAQAEKTVAVCRSSKSVGMRDAANLIDKSSAGHVKM